MRHSEVIEINKEIICNLSRVPVSIYENPCYKTTLQLLESKGKFDFTTSSLFKHYQDYNPKSLYDLYGAVEKLKHHSYCHAFLPWIHTRPVENFPDHAFITRDSTFIEKQVNKLENLINSFAKHGYCPENFRDRKEGHITGYFIEGNSRRRFYVVSGNHRAAVLSALYPDQKIRVILEKESFMKAQDRQNRGAFRTLYKLSDVNSWPSVRSSFVTSAGAKRITSKYLEI